MKNVPYLAASVKLRFASASSSLGRLSVLIQDFKKKKICNSLKLLFTKSDVNVID